jgi:hypothetical protein
MEMPHLSKRASLLAHLVVAAALSACATVSTRPRLSRAEVIVLADAQVRHDLRHTNLAEYQHTSVRYDPEKHAWYLGYRHKKVSSTWFDVVVDDTTRKAEVWMP